MPSAPNSRAVRASTGVSALVLTSRRRTSSAQPMTLAKSPDSSGCTISTSPAMISPVDPSMVRMSPLETVRLPTVRRCPASSMWSAPAPDTQGRPMPRATTAAWLVIPPRLVRMPCAACIPWMSSGLVSVRARMTLSPSAAKRSASSDVNTTAPDAAPGEAGRPLASTSRSASAASVGCNSWSSDAESIRASTSRGAIRPSSAMSTAILRAARAVRLPDRVCNIHSLFRWTVNSMSCMSR